MMTIVWKKLPIALLSLSASAVACGTKSSGTGGTSSSATGVGGAATAGSAVISSSTATASGTTTVSTGSGTPMGGMHVVKGSGTAKGYIADPSGAALHLHGADRSGTEYACLWGNIFDGPSDQASLDAMKAWKINAVRVPLNEDCWLGINGVPAASSGATYKQAIRAYVTLLENNGMTVILDLHWAAPGSELANGQLGMADADHAPTFWSEVAAAYAADHDHVIFDLFNEPFITDWTCWLKGGTCAMDSNGQMYQAAGMATLLKSVRAAGADNVVIMGGLDYSSDFAQWVTEVNSIPTLAAPLDGLTTDNIAVSWHTYTFQSVNTGCPSKYNGYTGTCLSAAQTAQNYGMDGLLGSGYPVLLGELGIDIDKADPAPYSQAQAQDLATWLSNMLGWVDQQGVDYLAWDWSIHAGPLLITAYDGTATPFFGVTYKAHLSTF